MAQIVREMKLGGDTDFVVALFRFLTKETRQSAFVRQGEANEDFHDARLFGFGLEDAYAYYAGRFAHQQAKDHFGFGVVFPEDFVLIPTQQQIDKVVVVHDEKVELDNGDWNRTKVAIVIVRSTGAFHGRLGYKVSLVYSGGETAWLKSSAVEKVVGQSLEDLATSR